MRFLVRAIDRSHRVSTVVLDAVDVDAARKMAAARGLAVLSLSQPGAKALAWSSQRATQLSPTLFAEELLALLEAGLNVREAIEAQRDHVSAEAGKACLDHLLARLDEGLKLSQALATLPDVFPALLVGVVQAAEGTSDLPQSLHRYIDYQARMDAVRHRVVSASIYPLILMVVGGGVALFLIGYVVPRFSALMKGTGKEMPWASRMLMAWGDLASAHPWVALSIGLGLVLVPAWALHVRWRDAGMLGLLSLMPGAAKRVETFELSRLYMTLGMLLEGGLPLVQALNLVSPVLAMQRRQLLPLVQARIQEGLPLSVALDQAGLSTSMALRLIKVGEQSGRLGDMLLRTAAFYDKENARWIERFSKSFEPILMAGIGLVVGLIVMLLYMPIFDLAGSIQP